MGMFIRVCAISVGMALGTGMAQAEDLPAAGQAIVAPSDIRWTGFHAGLGAGGSYNSADIYSEGYDYDWDDNYFFQSLNSDDGEFGWFGTAETGFDWQFGSWVVGVGANYDASHGEDIFADKYWDDTDGTCSEDDFGCSFTYKSHELTIGDTWALTARLGMLVNPRTLVYGLAGYSEAEISVNGFYGVDDDFSTTINDTDWRSGFVVGAGAETMLNEHVSLKGEYRFARYGGMDGFTGPGGGDYYQLLNADDPTVQSIRMVLSWRISH
jgi:outer membrane immunogenic protein